MMAITDTLNNQSSHKIISQSTTLHKHLLYQGKNAKNEGKLTYVDVSYIPYAFSCK